MTFDFENFFRIFSIQATTVEWLYLAISFSDGCTSSEYLGHIRVSRSWVQGQGHGSEKAVACNSKTTGRKLPGLERDVCYDNDRNDLEFMTFDLEDILFVFFNSNSKY